MSKLSLTMPVASCCRRRILAPSVLIVATLLIGTPVRVQAQQLAAEDQEAFAAQDYAKSLDLIDSARYTEALQSLRLIVRTYPNFSAIGNVRTRISVLSESADAGPAMGPYLKALNAREAGYPLEAIDTLSALVADYPSSTLRDDAYYLMAYIQVLDRFDYEAAHAILTQLKIDFPSSSYQDAADYLSAISLEQMGATREARLEFLGLRDRHTALSLPFGFRWPRGNVLSRYWFDRVTARLNILNRQLQNASSVRSTHIGTNGVLELSIHVNGTDLDLVLSPSPLTRQTSWRDGALNDTAPPAVGVYAGTVEGHTDSWARVVFSESMLTGMVAINGVTHKIEPNSLIGTLDYYQPKNKSNRYSHGLDGSVSVEGDALIPPPAPLPEMNTRANQSHTDLRMVPMSVVVDSQFNRYHGGEGLTIALNHLNVTDGFYREYGLSLSLDETVVLGDSNDPMDLGATTLETVLRSFRDYRLSQSTLFNDSALVYLFSGNPRTDATIGLAWIDTACRTDGYDVGVSTPSNFGEILLAHEVGHSLGSAHDTDTVCADEANNLMWPNISSATPIELSSCSAASVVATRSKSCLMNAIDVTLSADTDGSVVTLQVDNPDNSITVDATLVIESSKADQLQWPQQCVSNTPARIECTLREIPAGGGSAISFMVNAGAVDNDSMMSAHVVPNDVVDPSLDNNVVATHILYNSAHNPDTITTNPNFTANAADDGTPARTGPSSGGVSWWFLLLLGTVLQRNRHRIRGGLNN